MKMKAAVIREYKKPLSVEQVELAPPKEKEVLVKTAYTGFCHSDLSFIDGAIPFPLPAVIGHEASGIVEDVGPGVTSLKKGDHVVATWMIPCGHCPECRNGRGYTCRTSHAAYTQGKLPDMTSRLKDAKGNELLHHVFVAGFAEYMVLVEEGAIKIRDDMPLDQVCVMGCAVPTGFGAVYNVAGVKPGNSVAIWGMGGVGLNVVSAAKLRGGDPIIAVDIEGSKEAIAREFGATHFIDSSKEDPVPAVQLLTGGVKMPDGTIMGGGAHFVFEVTGNPGAQTQAYWAIGIAGKMVLVGIPPADTVTELGLTWLPPQCKTIEGTLYGDIQIQEDIPPLANVVMKGDYRLDKLITNKFKVEEINDVAEAMRKRQIIGRWVCEFD
jgi:S-(hydroxymethyl)glutathione dehydrogenase/alcohol dehydrogenase